MGEPELLCFNGMDGESGEYALPPMTGADLARLIQKGASPENLSELRFRYRQATQRTYGVREGVDPLKLGEAGWGIIFSQQADPAIQLALKELIDLRREQAGAVFHLYAGFDGYRAGESKGSFLARNGAGPGPTDPENVPYYLLIVGSPEEISYQFQSQLDVQYAVGRIDFETPEDYARYAHTVVRAERGDTRRARTAGFWGVSNADDAATRLSTDGLLEPLYTELKGKYSQWNFNASFREQAIKEQLARLVGGNETPALLFTGSHGMSFPAESKRQTAHQGALLCQDWPGPVAWQGKGAIPPDLYFSGDDVRPDADLGGMVACFFACYGVGTPLYDEFSKQAQQQQRTVIAPAPFVSRLPMKLLSLANGGAQAVIGHVDRAWGYSFYWPQVGTQTTVFSSVLERLLKGNPVGSAVEYLNQRYAELATVLSDELEEIEFGKKFDAYELAGLWTANNDARGYSVFGDPAVRLPVSP